MFQHICGLRQLILLHIWPILGVCFKQMMDCHLNKLCIWILPKLDHLKIFGCLAYVYISKWNRPKLEPNQLKCMFTQAWIPISLQVSNLEDMGLTLNNDNKLMWTSICTTRTPTPWKITITFNSTNQREQWSKSGYFEWGEWPKALLDNYFTRTYLHGKEVEWQEEGDRKNSTRSPWQRIWWPSMHNKFYIYIVKISKPMTINKQFNTMGGKKSCNKNLIPLSRMELGNLWTCHLGKNPSQQNGFTRQNWLQMEKLKN